MIKPIDASHLNELKTLYDDAGWIVYLKDETKFKRMFDHSLCVLGYFVDGQLVGSVRSVGDQAHILYIQDILVLSSHRRQGIGRKLLKAMCNHYPDVRQKVLITDQADQGAHEFYRSVGFKTAQDMHTTCFVKFN